jgi:hypothetical protein
LPSSPTIRQGGNESPTRRIAFVLLIEAGRRSKRVLPKAVPAAAIDATATAMRAGGSRTVRRGSDIEVLKMSPTSIDRSRP